MQFLFWVYAGQPKQVHRKAHGQGMLAGLDGMRVALNDDDKIAMQEAQGSSELNGHDPQRREETRQKEETQQTTDADEVAAQSKAFQFMPSSFGASKAGGRNIQRCMEDSLESVQVKLSPAEHLRRAWQCQKHRSGLGGHSEEITRVLLELLWSCEEGRQVSADLQVPGGHQACFDGEACKKAWFFQAGVRDPQRISDDERHCMSMPQKSQLCMLCDGFPWMDKTVFLIFFCVELLVFWWAQGIHKSMVPQSPGRT